MSPSSSIHARIFHHLPKCQKKKRRSVARSLMRWSRRLRLLALCATKSQPCQLRRKGAKPPDPPPAPPPAGAPPAPAPAVPEHPDDGRRLVDFAEGGELRDEPRLRAKASSRNTNGLTSPRTPSARFATSLRTC